MCGRLTVRALLAWGAGPDDLCARWWAGPLRLDGPSEPVWVALAVLCVGGQAGQEVVPAVCHCLRGDPGVAEVQLACLRPASGELEPQLTAGPLVVPGVRDARPLDRGGRLDVVDAHDDLLV